MWTGHAGKSNDGHPVASGGLFEHDSKAGRDGPFNLPETTSTNRGGLIARPRGPTNERLSRAGRFVWQKPWRKS